MSKKPVIAISGPPGAGSTSIAKGLAEKLGLEYFSPGFMQKGIAIGKNQSKAAIDVWKSKLGTSKTLHKSLDNIQIERAKEGNVIICGKLSIYFLKNIADYKIWTDAPLRVRAKRTAGRDKISVKDAEKLIAEREKLERKNWRKIYGFDYLTQKYSADFVLNNSNLTLKEAVNKILDFIKRNPRK